MDKSFLQLVGLDFYNTTDFEQKNIVLRNGNAAIIWIHKDNGHGILDKQYWPKEILANYYEEKYRSEYSGNVDGSNFESDSHFNLYHKINKKQFDHIKPYLTNSTKYLEIGPSFGGIISQVIDNGVHECHGIEPNKFDAEYVTNKHDNVTIYNSKIEDTDLPTKYYDIITSFEVLEHMVSVKSYLNTCFNALAEDGDIVIEVPNHNDVLLDYYKSPTYKKFYYHNAHIHYFTAKSLTNICHVYGFKGECETLQIYPFFNHVNWCINDKPQSSAESAIHTPIPTKGINLIEKSINEFYKKVESEYDQLINDFKIGGELIFKGKKYD
tara:strand:+ start:790 stop:1764 length:975 start_codon:yes stop_codon:yes gene_type:complete